MACCPAPVSQSLNSQFVLLSPCTQGVPAEFCKETAAEYVRKLESRDWWPQRRGRQRQRKAETERDKEKETARREERVKIETELERNRQRDQETGQSVCIRDSPGETAGQSGHTHTSEHGGNRPRELEGRRCERASLRTPRSGGVPPPSERTLIPSPQSLNPLSIGLSASVTAAS